MRRSESVSLHSSKVYGQKQERRLPQTVRAMRRAKKWDIRIADPGPHRSFPWGVERNGANLIDIVL
jgi:hypothetical protein